MISSIRLRFLAKRLNGIGHFAKGQAREIENSPNLQPPTSNCDDISSNRNEFGIPMVSQKLRRRLFDSEKVDVPPEEKLKKIRQKIFHAVGKSDILSTDEANFADDDSIAELCDFDGRSLDEHFRRIAEDQIRDYRSMAEQLASSSIPEVPKEITWVMRPGWTMYVKGENPISVDFPREDAVVLDVEVCQNADGRPTLAVAVSWNAWYSWCSDDLCDAVVRGDQLPKAASVAEMFSGDSVSSIGDHFDSQIPRQANGSRANQITLEDLISLESKRGQEIGWDRRKKLVVGHNVAFDRSYIKEQYFLEKSDLRFLDTMSMHIATNGFANFQRMIYMKNMNKVDESISENGRNSQTEANDWESKGSMNSLEAVHGYHCPDGKAKLNKKTRDIFIDGDLSDVQKDFHRCMAYCANDVYATWEVFQRLLADFLRRFQHPVTLGGMLEMGTAYLPVNDNWWHFVEAADESYNAQLGKIKDLLIQLANEAVGLLKDERYKSDPWLWDEDWSTISNWSFYKKGGKQKVVAGSDDVQTAWSAFAASARKSQPYLPNFPKWYRTLCNGTLTKAEEINDVVSSRFDDKALPDLPNTWGPQQITVNMRIAPKLLRMNYLCYPIHYHQKHGWGYLVPNSDGAVNERDSYPVKLPGGREAIFPLKELQRMVSENQSRFADQIPGLDHERVEVDLPGVSFYKLPHKDGSGANVGNPLAKDFIRLILSGTLHSQRPEHAKLLAEVNRSCAYWKVTRDRVLSQIPILFYQFNSAGEKIRTIDDGDLRFGAIVPRVITAGTVTRRAVEPLWMTASNVKENVIGSELKGLVQAPPGYVFVGADVDSQELWIASLLGDSKHHKLHGCTPFSWMLLLGNKADGTDQHSMVASELGVTRDQAKVLNYGRIYGAGLPFAIVLLKKFRPGESLEKIQELATRLYSKTKGRRKKFCSLNDQGWELVRRVKDWKMHSQHRFPFSDAKKAFQDGRESHEQYCVDEWLEWFGGTESDVFNRLERIALSKEAATPVLGCRLSKTLELGSKNKDFLPSRINWVVQSSGVDYLHLMLICMRWLFEKYEIDGRFSISIHDEVRYLVAEKDQYRAALALQISNLLTRAMFVSKMGMTGLPQSVAYFSKVDIDKALRKEVNIDGVTLSNTLGYGTLYGIPQGSALDIKQIMSITGGRLDKDQ